MRVQVFLSHVTQEEPLAALLKDKIERHFLGLVQVFVSSDQESIRAGHDWLDALKRALSTANLEILLCSPLSITRPWLNFEAGAAWLRGIPVVPLCHSGLSPADLPMPLSVMQGGSISDWKALSRLYRTIAQQIPSEVPDIDMRALSEELSKLEHNASEDENRQIGKGSVATGAAGRLVDLEADRLRKAATGDLEAIKGLLHVQSAEAFSTLIDLAVNDIDDEVKVIAIKTLARFRSPGDIEPLCELLVEDRWMVAEACAKALGRFKNPKAIPYLIKASDQHVDWVTTRECATALGVFAPDYAEQVCPALIRALELGSFEGEASAQSLVKYGSVASKYILNGLSSGGLLQNSNLALKTLATIADKETLSELRSIRDKWRAEIKGGLGKQLLSEIDRLISQLE